MRLNELLKEISIFNEVNIDLHENKLIYHDKKKGCYMYQRDISAYVYFGCINTCINTSTCMYVLLQGGGIL